MIDSDLEELIQREIDGAATPADTARLHALAATRADVKARLEGQRRAAEALRRAERLDPPARMAADVMAAVRKTRLPAAPMRAPGGKPSWFRMAGPSAAPRLAVAMAFTFVVGVGLGIVAVRQPAFSRSDTDALSGTSLSGDRIKEKRAAAAHAGWNRSFTRGGVRADVETRTAAGVLVVEIRFESTDAVDIVLEGTGARAFSVDGAPGGDVVLGARQVRFTHPAGRRRYTLTFDAKDSPPALKLRLGEGEGSVFALGPEGS